MRRLLAPLTEWAYAALRFVAGATFFFHGAQKILGWLAERPGPAPWSQHWIGGILELVCGAAIALGLFTRWFAFLASGEMAVAYVQFHWKPWEAGPAEKIFPIVNKGELALLYCFLFLYVACRGAGRASLDGLFARTRAPAPLPPPA